jgi:hypothetical protein
VNRKRTLRRLRFRAQMRLDALMARMGLVRLERVEVALNSVVMDLDNASRERIEISLTSSIASTPGTDATEDRIAAALINARHWDDQWESYIHNR